MLNPIAFLLLSLFTSEIFPQDNSACGDWTAFKDEKCFKLFNHLTSWSGASNYCIQQDKESTLVIIKTKDEQDAIVKLLNASDVVDNVWIGITKKDGVFKNADQTEVDFKNWAENRPMINKTRSDCVDLSTDDLTYGQWFDEKCQKQNVLICQKTQPWSITRLQNILLDTKREFEAKVLYLQQNPIPIGFIYVQVLGQREPKILWPNTQWLNISPKLAGLFFRVEGGQAAQFGQIQEQQTQSIDLVRKGSKDNEALMDTPFTIGNSDRCVYTGTTGNPPNYLHMKQNLEEIRPKNSAVRVWQRIK